MARRWDDRCEHNRKKTATEADEAQDLQNSGIGSTRACAGVSGERNFKAVIPKKLVMAKNSCAA